MVYDATSGLALPLAPVPIQELLPASYSSTLTWKAIQASNLAQQQLDTTNLGHTASFASASLSTRRQQIAPALASSLIAMPVCRTISQLGPVLGTLRWGQIHTSGQLLPCDRLWCSLMLIFPRMSGDKLKFTVKLLCICA